MGLRLDLHTSPAASSSSVKGKGAISRSPISKRKHKEKSRTLVPSMKDDTGGKSEGSKPAVTITCLPAEIRHEILCHSMAFTDLRSTILAHPSLYQAFHDSRKTAYIDVIWNIFRKSIPGSDLWKRMWTDTIRCAVTDKYLSFERAIENCIFPCLSTGDSSALVKWVTWRKEKAGIKRSLYDMVAISICGYTSERYHWDQESYLRQTISLDQIREHHSLLQRLKAKIRVLDLQNGASEYRNIA